MDTESKTMKVLLALGVIWLLLLGLAPFLFPLARDATHDAPDAGAVDGGSPAQDAGTEVAR